MDIKEVVKASLKRFWANAATRTKKAAGLVRQSEQTLSVSSATRGRPRVGGAHGGVRLPRRHLQNPGHRPLRVLVAGPHHSPAPSGRRLGREQDQCPRLRRRQPGGAHPTELRRREGFPSKFRVEGGFELSTTTSTWVSDSARFRCLATDLATQQP